MNSISLCECFDAYSLVGSTVRIKDHDEEISVVVSE